MCGSLSASSPHVVEPDCRANSRVWTDLLLQESNPSEYLHGRYTWVHGASSRSHPSRLLHFEYASSGVLSAQVTTRIPMILASCGEGLPTESHYRPAGSGTADSSVAGSSVTGSSVTGSCAEGSSDGTPLAPTTPIFQELAGNPIPAGSSAAE